MNSELSKIDVIDDGVLISLIAASVSLFKGIGGATLSERKYIIVRSILALTMSKERKLESKIVQREKIPDFVSAAADVCCQVVFSGATIQKSRKEILPKAFIAAGGKKIDISTFIDLISYLTCEYTLNRRWDSKLSSEQAADQMSTVLQANGYDQTLGVFNIYDIRKILKLALDITHQ